MRDALSYSDWNELCSGQRDVQLTALLGALAPAIGRVGFQYLRRQRLEPSLAEDTRQDLESTTTLASTLRWTSRLLCVPPPRLYLVPALPGLLRLVPHDEDLALSCSRALGSGFTLPELTFLWARELAFARPDALALSYFPDATALTRLVHGALAVAGVVNVGDLDAEAKRIASGLKRELRGSRLEPLLAAAAQLPTHHLDQRARAFLRSAELVAGRVGLVACGRLDVSLALSERFPRDAATPLAERRADLLRFMVSAELGQIRTTLGLTLG